MPDIFDEVDEDIRAEKAQAFLRRYGALGIVLMLLTMVGTGVYVWRDQQQKRAAEATASRFLAAQKAAAPKPHAPPPAAAAADLAAVAAQGPAGYRTLARLQLAAVQWQRGDHAAAIATWQSVADDPGGPPLLRDYATLASVQHQADTGDAAALKARVLPLASGPWHLVAAPLLASLDIRLGRTADARAILKEVAEDPLAPQSVREVVQAALGALGQ